MYQIKDKLWQTKVDKDMICPLAQSYVITLPHFFSIRGIYLIIYLSSENVTEISRR